MNIYFAYTVGAPDQIFYGKYYGYTSSNLSDTELLNSIFTSLQQCYSVHSVAEITINILSHCSTDTFSDRDIIKYNFVYRNTSPPQFYWNGTQMN